LSACAPRFIAPHPTSAPWKGRAQRGDPTPRAIPISISIRRSGVKEANTPLADEVARHPHSAARTGMPLVFMPWKFPTICVRSRPTTHNRWRRLPTSTATFGALRLLFWVGKISVRGRARLHPRVDRSPIAAIRCQRRPLASSYDSRFFFLRENRRFCLEK